MKEYQETVFKISNLNVLGVIEQKTKKEYVPIVDLCKYLGLNSNMQIKRIKSQSIFRDNIKILPMQTKVGIKNKFCLELHSLPFYLVNIDESKCKDNVSKKIVDLQIASMEILKSSSITKECFDINSNTKDENILKLEELVFKNYKDGFSENEVIDNNKALFDFSTISKIFEIEENDLIQLCKDFGLLKEDKLPKQEHIDKHLFKISLENIGFGKDCIAIPMTKITPIGFIKIKNLLQIKRG